MVRNQPAVVVLANEDPRNNFLEIAAGATRAVPISWNSLDDLPGNYSVQFQGFNADGQIVVEGGSGFRIPSATRLGGGVILDPPLLQAGLGQSVSISGQLANLGNIAIPAGDTEVTVKLVQADSRPPLPSVPFAQADLAAGAPIERPVGSAMDAAGNFYTVNLSTQQLLRITPAGVTSVLTTLQLPAIGVGQGQVDGISMGVDARIWIARSNGYTTKVSLSAPYAQTHHANGIPNPGAYFLDAASNEYFAARLAGRDAVYKRTPSGAVTRIIDTSVGNFERAAVGPDGALYVVSTSSGSIQRVDPATATMTPEVTGINLPHAIAFSADGTLYFSDNVASEILIKRRNADNSVTQFARTTGTIEQMRFADDGALYLLMRSPNEIRKVTANGVVSDFAKSFSSDASTLRFDPQGNLLALSNELRRRNLDGSMVDLTASLGTVRELELSDTAEYWMVSSRVSKRLAGVISTVYADASFYGQSLAVSANDELYVAGTKGTSTGIFKVISPTTSAPWLDLPSTIDFLDVLAGGEGIAADTNALYRISAEGDFKKLSASVSSLTRLAVAQNSDVYVQAGAPAEVSRVDLLSGKNQNYRCFARAAGEF